MATADGSIHGRAQNGVASPCQRQPEHPQSQLSGAAVRRLPYSNAHILTADGYLSPADPRTRDELYPAHLVTAADCLVHPNHTNFSQFLNIQKLFILQNHYCFNFTFKTIEHNVLLVWYGDCVWYGETLSNNVKNYSIIPNANALVLNTRACRQ